MASVEPRPDQSVSNVTELRRPSLSDDDAVQFRKGVDGREVIEVASELGKGEAPKALRHAKRLRRSGQNTGIISAAVFATTELLRRAAYGIKHAPATTTAATAVTTAAVTGALAVGILHGVDDGGAAEVRPDAPGASRDGGPPSDPAALALAHGPSQPPAAEVIGPPPIAGNPDLEATATEQERGGVVEPDALGGQALSAFDPAAYVPDVSELPERPEVPDAPEAPSELPADAPAEPELPSVQAPTAPAVPE